jgi:hypothetical protein
MKQRWCDEELVECWTLTETEWQLIDQRSERGRLGFTVLLKFFQIEGRFPSSPEGSPEGCHWLSGRESVDSCIGLGRVPLQWPQR